MADDGKKKKIDKVRFVYQKAPHHHTFHADGVWASVTPQVEIQFAFFNNLKPMPDEVTHFVREDGGLGEEAPAPIPQNILRETDVTIVMNKEVVKGMINLLQRMLAQAEDYLKEIQPAPSVVITSNKPPETE